MKDLIFEKPRDYFFEKPSKKKANVDHFAHQATVSGVGAHKNKKAYDRKRDKKDIEREAKK